MGTGGSFLRSQDDDDILGTDLDGNSGGVIKRIPIEMKPRGKLGLRSVSSFGRKQPKGGSLRSALSVDLENPEVEKIRKEFEMYRLNKENDIANMQKKEQKLETENKRLRAELLALQKTCTKLRDERESALEAEDQALARAAAFECDRDKVQRQFKIFRETKESEIQNLLRAKRELENKLAKLQLAHSYLSEDVDSTSRSGIPDGMGNSHIGDWWMNLESEPSLGSTIQLHQPLLRGPEFAQSLMEIEGPFTNVNKEDWSAAVANLSHVLPAIPEHVPSCMIRMYISAPSDVAAEVDIFIKEYVPKLSSLCENEGRTFLAVYLTDEESEPINSQILERERLARKIQIEMATIFVAFLADTINRFTEQEFHQGCLDSTGAKQSIFCFKDTATKGPRIIHPEVTELRQKVQESGRAKIINGSSSTNKILSQVYTELEKLVKIEMGVNTDVEAESAEDENELLCGGKLWDVNGDNEHMEKLSCSVISSCELTFEKHYERLNSHVSAAGPLPPLLVLGAHGSGRSLLLSKWIQLQHERGPGSLLLYHFVGSESSVSADPFVMIRRFTSQLHLQIFSPPPLTCDPTRLAEEFPRLLEKVSSRSPSGAILVLDSIDRFEQAELNLKWLLDPLPVDTRIIVSACEDTCPQAWRSWPTLKIDPLSNKNVKELLRAELAIMGYTLHHNDETKVLTHCRTNPTCNPLYVMVLTRHIASCSRYDGKLNKHLDTILSTSNSVDLYISLLHIIREEYESQENNGNLRSILRYLCASRSGLNESELFDLIPSLSWNYLSLILTVLSSHLIIKYQASLITFAYDRALKAAEEYCFDKDDEKGLFQYQEDLILYFSQRLRPGQVSCRVADELPWLIKQSGEKEELRRCILNPCIFQRLFARGMCGELIGYWQFIGEDKTSMAQAYINSTKKMEEAIGEYNDLITLPRIADMYEFLGRFLKDLGLLNQALPALQRALEVREMALDPDHPVVARSLHQLAGLHAQWGKYSTAEALYKQGLDIYQNAYGKDHFMVAKELDALASLYQKQDKHDLAEPLRKKSLSIRKKVKSPRSPSYLRGVDALQKRALQLEELSIGPDSPDVARSLNELGVLYYLQGNFETAGSFFKRSLEMREVTLPAEHPDIGQSLNNLAALYNDRKQFDKAEPLYERALQIRAKHYSFDHPSVAAIVKHLAMLYKKQGKLEQAEPLYRQAVEIREKSFGMNHPSVATALVNLAVLYSQQNKYKDAEPLYERALRIYEESLGAQHPRVAETLRNLAVMKYEQKDYETAAKLYKKATEIKESEATYHSKVLSRRSSSGDTNSTVKNLLQR